MNQLGLRLALAGGRRPLALTALGIALGTAVLLLALTIDPAIQTRAGRLAWRDPTILSLDPSAINTRVTYLNDAYADQKLLRILVAGTDPAAPVPPGIPSLPDPGTSYLSPALADLVAREPDDELGDRFGEVVGEVGDEALADPSELVAIVGTVPDELSNALAVSSFEAVGQMPMLEGFLRTAFAIGIVGLLAPVGIFVATATRLSAARRAERFATVRLVGASPAQARRLAAVEAFVAGSAGAIGGIVLFFLFRPVAALLPFDGHQWFVNDLVPELASAVAVVAAVPVVSVAAGLVALRGALAAPLGTARASSPGSVSATRLLPLMLAIVFLAVSITWEASGGSGDPDTRLIVIGGAFLLLVGGLVWAGPYLVSLVANLLHRRAGQPATLIAARRLGADPRGGFYAISGVVLAVFIGSVFHALIVPIQSSTDLVAGGGLRTSTVSAIEVNLFQVGADRIESVVGELNAIEGVERVVIERDLEVFFEGGHVVRTLVMSCDDAGAVLAFAVPTCGTADLLTAAEAIPIGTYELTDLGIEPGSTWTGSITITRVASMTVPDGSYLPALLDPAAVERGVEAIAPSRILVATDGASTTIERVRTTIETALPATLVLSGRDDAALRYSVFDELGWLINFGLVAVMLVAGSSLAMAVIGGLIERRRPLALLRLSGMPMSQLRHMVFIEAVGPLILASLTAALAGVGVAQLIARLGRAADPGLPGLSIFIPVGIGIGGGLLVVLAVLPFLERATDSDATRFE